MASSQAADKIRQFFAEQVSVSNPIAPRMGKVVNVGDAQIHEIGQSAFGGTASTLSRTATSASASDFFSFKASYSLSQKYVKHIVPSATLRTDYAMADAGRQLATVMQAALDAEMAAGLFGLFAQNHPRAGAGAGQVGAGKKFLDTGLAYLAGEGGAGTQDNLLTAALSESALNSAIKLLVQYRGDRGNVLNLGTNGGLSLIVAPKNMQLAHELVKSQLSGADMAANFVNGVVSNIVTTPNFTDDDDWALVDVANAPYGLAIGDDVQVTVTPSEDELFTILVAKYRSTFWFNPYEAGIIGSNVA